MAGRFAKAPEGSPDAKVWLRLLDAATTRTAEGGGVLASFARGPRRVAIRPTPATVQDPFAPGLFERFRCPAP